MSYLLWQRDRNVGVGAARVVLRAAEVPLLADAQRLRDRLEQLNDDAAQRIAAAEQDARVQGYVQGREEAAREVQEEVAKTVLALRQKAAQDYEQMRGQIAALALQVARKVLGQMPGESVLAALAQNAARDMLPAPALTLVVHPDQCDAVRTRLAALADADPAQPRFDVKPDPECKPGVCRIETEFGTVDASLDAQLGRIAAAWGVPA
jgi:type III secretion system HrpE/YscL family protein